jgi:hypothetical protein
MMKRWVTAYGLIGGLSLYLGGTTSAYEYHLRGQVSGWYIEARNEGERLYSTGVQYIPQLDLEQEINSESFVDLEASVNAWAGMMSADPGDTAVLDLYRLKLRYATAMTETRLGLQVMNFGPAHLLRPLRWFDRLDPRDPLQLTDGVYALLFRYVASNNSSIWLWGLYGNDGPKGAEILPSSDDRPESGGRLQVPLGPGEAALSFHSRGVESPIPGSEAFDETRFGLDGRWDIEIGLWFETVHREQYGEGAFDQSMTSLMVGADYTLGIGNGLHVLCEHMGTSSWRDGLFSHMDEATHTTAFMLGYPSGYLDYVNAIGFFDWEEGDFYSFLSWQRTWDNFALNLSLFRNPEQLEEGPRSMSARGTGGQLIIMFNH